MKDSIKDNHILCIAEIGHNHMGYMRHAKILIEEAKACGCDIAKFQAYNVDKIKETWQSRYAELKFSEHTKEEFKELKEYCDKVGIEFMASAFDIEHFKWLEGFGVKRHKIASRSIYEKDLISAMEKTGKPIIASLGKIDERGVPKIKNAKYLFCVSEYPAYITEEQFPVEFIPGICDGFSDHSQSMYWCREAVKRGAAIIEKHFTLSKELPITQNGLHKGFVSGGYL